jgi:hypothetical protein
MYKIKQYISLLFYHSSLLLIIFLYLNYGAFGQNLFVNGSMEGKPTTSCDGNTNGTVPEGWKITASSPDINMAAKKPIGGCSNWLGKPVASPNGGYFESIVSFGSQHGSSEGFGQVVSGLIIGNQYVFSYYWANTPTQNAGLVIPSVAVSGFLENNALQPKDTTAPWKWTKHSVVLTASAKSAVFDFQGKTVSDQDIGYLSFDGISIVSCLAGPKPPVLSKENVVISSKTTNLVLLQNQSAPYGSQFLWHTGTPGTLANMVKSPSEADPGTYYAAFYDSNNGCFSPTSSKVIISTSHKKRRDS